MKKIVFILLLFVSVTTFAQQKVTFEIDHLPKKPISKLFLAGNFNMWNPDDSAYLFSQRNGQWTLSTSLEKGTYEYKITRGDWRTVEEHENFKKPMRNRVLKLNSDTIIHLNIGAWGDDRPGGNKLITHTASPQVHIMDTAFYMPQLKRTRRVWIYLPKGYATSKSRYPVLYMQDGQNVFDAATSFSGEWGIDEFLDSLKNSCRQVIVVAIDNGGAKRMTEYNPWEFMNFGKGEGKAYVDFLVKTLKPYIDKRYRTKRNKQNTSIAGSSMGGLISYYAVLEYPKTFGSAGIFSPAFWTASGIDSLTLARIQNVNSKLYFYAGGKEGKEMVPDMQRIEQEIRHHSKSLVKDRIGPNSKHNEAAWQKYFPGFFKWVFCK